jgi:nitroreductase
MELMDVLQNRRAVREYTDARIEKPTVERLIRAAILAPSAVNLQPWTFAALLDPESIERYGRRGREWLLANFAQTSFDAHLHDLVKDPKFVMFHGAPALVIILAKTSTTQAAEDCCLAAENLMLAARNEGLGTCWIGLARPWLDLPATKAELKVPGNLRVVAPIILGYPRSWPESHGRNPAEIYWL